MRQVELRFSGSENLYRTFEVSQLAPGQNHLGHNSLRLQISVARSKYINPSNLQQKQLDGKFPKFNGVAQISVADARISGYGLVKTACIDEPTKGNEPHALVALWTEAEPSQSVEEDIERVRILLSRKMVVVLEPNKPSP